MDHKLHVNKKQRLSSASKLKKKVKQAVLLQAEAMGSAFNV
jgi:hypothetical protein